MENKMKPDYSQDLTGRRFGRYVVLRAVNPDAKLNSLKKWVCQCDCGNIQSGTSSHNLLNRRTESCGCLRREKLRAASTIHGHAPKTNRQSKTYSTWTNMKNRCRNPKSRMYDRYGGRGITVCDRWYHSFEAFLEDMGERPAGCTIDRIDVNGNYCKENCRWLAKKEQNSNRSTCRYMTVNGVTLIMKKMCQLHGISYKKVCGRKRLGWSDHEAIFGKSPSV